MGNTQQRMSASSPPTFKMKTSMSMTTTNTLGNKRAPPSSVTIQNIQEHDTSLISHVSSDQRGNGDRHRLDNGCGITSATKCFPKHHHHQQQQQQHASFGHRLLNKWRKNVLRTSQTHLDNLNDGSKTGAASSSLASHFNSRNRSTTDQNLLIIKDNFVEFIAENDDDCTNLNSNETNNNFIEADDMVDLNPDLNNNNLTIDSKFLRDVNQKLKSIQDDDDDSSSDAIEIELERLDNVETKKKLSKSPAIFNISQYARPKDDAAGAAAMKTDENVKDFFNNEPQMTSSESYGDDDDDSFSSSSIGENFEEFEKRHRLRPNNKKSSVASPSSSPSSPSSSTSSLSSVSSVSSFTSSHSSMNVQLTPLPPASPPQQPAVTLAKNINTRLRNFLPALKLKLQKGGGGGANCSKTKSKNLKETEKHEQQQQQQQPITDALLYSFRDRFEIKDKEPETVETEQLPSSTQDFESLCFIDETSSYTLSSSSSLNVAQGHLATKTPQTEQPRPPTTQSQNEPSSAFKLLNQVNKKLNLYRIRKQVKTMHHSLNTNNMESVSNKISLNEDTSAAIYDNNTIEKIINKENNFVDYNDNNEVNIDDGVLNIDDDDDDDDNDSVKIIKFSKAKKNTNEINSIARLKINAPLASSENTTPLSRSIDYLNRLDQFKIVLNNNNNNNFIRNQQIASSNISETMPIKKYYRLSGGANTTIYNSPN